MSSVLKWILFCIRRKIVIGNVSIRDVLHHVGNFATVSRVWNRVRKNYRALTTASDFVVNLVHPCVVYVIQRSLNFNSASKMNLMLGRCSFSSSYFIN